MEEKLKQYDFMIGIAFLFIFINSLYAIAHTYKITDLEDKINGNCIYINNEFYCKD